MGTSTKGGKGTATPSAQVGAETRKYPKAGSKGRKNVRPEPIVNK